MKPATIVLTLVAILAVAAIGVYSVWTGLEDVEISIHGMIALGLGVLLTFGLGAGLMFLVFYSSHKGYDDTALPPTEPPRDRDD